MSAADELPTSANKPLQRPPLFVDTLRRCMKWLYYHPRIQRSQGYHFGILCCAIASATVLVINLTLTIWVFSHYGTQGGLATILDGSCTETKKLAMWTHLGINVLSTLLLGASNYTMQCLSSPTREDITRAHSQNVWLSIGTPSLRNLLRISRSRMLLWWLVAISSVPLHFMYNSAVSTTISAREINAFLVFPDFLTGAPIEIGHFSHFAPQIAVNASGQMSGQLNQAEQIARTLQHDQSNLQKLANTDCIGAYATEFVSSHGNVLVILSKPPDWGGYNTTTWVWWSQAQGAPDDTPWFCGDAPCDAKTIADAGTWQLIGLNVEYCLSQKVEEHCKLQFSGAILVVVVVCNFCKMTIMGYIAWKRPSEPLVTVGDAIASFLDHPDRTTIGNCLAGKDQFEKKSMSGPVGHQAPINWGQGTMRCDLGTSYWYKAVSVRQWTLLFILCIVITTATGVLINEGLQHLPYNTISYVWSLGVGRVTSKSLLHLPSEGLIPTILLANSPQIVLSSFYLTLNGILTSMLLADELNGYAHQRKALRVTSPTGKQRSTYPLHIPYAYSVPLLVIFGMLHWLVSQSLFLARVDVYDDDGSVDVAKSTSTCGYSLIAIFFVLVVFVIMMWFIAMTAFRTTKPGMPFMGSCSGAISAACHPPEDDKGASKLPVKWGVVEERTATRTGQAVGHCTFTSFEVKPPVKGGFYAGQKKLD